jgi:hypothetical protein
LANGLVLDAHLSPRSHLPLLPFVPSGSKLSSFWTYAFAYSANNVVQAKTILGSANNNLSSQKELLLWHQRLSHANLAWIQTLMRDRKWLEDCHMPLINVPYKCTFGMPDQGQMLNV